MRILISISFSLFLNATFLCSIGQGLIIPAGAYVLQQNGNIVTHQHFTNNGSFAQQGGQLVFSGSTQNITGSSATQFFNLTISGGSTSTIQTAGHSIKNILLSNGVLNANGRLTLLSDAAATAAISGSGAGQVLGNVAIQRYISNSFGYKYISSPFQNATVNELADELNLAASFPVLYQHSENVATNGWAAYTGTTGILQPLNGYAANFGTGTAAQTMSITGVVNNGVQSRNLFNNNRTFTQGFNLVGNPYPSPVDWNAAGWTRTNIDNAIYYFRAGSTNAYEGIYSSYVNGVSSDGAASNLIPAMQGFFVHVSNGPFPVAANLVITNTARTINATAPFLKITDDPAVAAIQLSAGYTDQEDLQDAAVLYLQAGATRSFDKIYDAIKLLNTDITIPNLYFIAEDAAKLSIQAIDDSNDSLLTFPLHLITQRDATVKWKTADLKNFPAKWLVYLEDQAVQKHYDLRTHELPEMQLAAGEHPDRFYLKLSRNVIRQDEAPANQQQLFRVSISASNLTVQANLAVNESASIQLFSASGQQVSQYRVSGPGPHLLPARFASGIYIVHMITTHQKQSQKILIPTP